MDLYIFRKYVNTVNAASKQPKTDRRRRVSPAHSTTTIRMLPNQSHAHETCRSIVREGCDARSVYSRFPGRPDG